MPQFDEDIHAYYDSRMLTLGKIKSRSLDANSLMLTALNVLVYAQLEGGIKELASRTIRDINRRGLPFGLLSPALLAWRNSGDLQRFRSSVTFDSIAHPSPFALPLTKVVPLKGINRSKEFNQMNWKSISRIYTGFQLDLAQVQPFQSEIEALVASRNEAAHQGILPPIALTFLEQQIRGNVSLVENVLTDLTLKVLTFFDKKLHLR